MAIGTPTNLLATNPAAVTDTTTSAAVTGTIINASSAGSLIVAFASLRTANTPTTCTFTDSHSLTWTTIITSPRAAAGADAIGWALDASGLNSGTITATFDVTGTRRGLSAYSVTGLATSTPVDTAVTNVANGNTGTPTVTAAGASTQANEIFFFLCRHNTTAGTDTGTPAAGYTEAADQIVGASTFMQHYLSYKIASATETPTGTFTPTVTTTNWDCSIVALKMASAAAASAKQLMMLGVG